MLLDILWNLLYLTYDYLSYGQKHILWGHSDLDLYPPNSHQFIIESEWMFASYLKKFPQGVVEISHSQEWDKHLGKSDIDLWLP